MPSSGKLKAGGAGSVVVVVVVVVVVEVVVVVLVVVVVVVIVVVVIVVVVMVVATWSSVVNNDNTGAATSIVTSHAAVHHHVHHHHVHHHHAHHHAATAHALSWGRVVVPVPVLGVGVRLLDNCHRGCRARHTSRAHHLLLEVGAHVDSTSVHAKTLKFNPFVQGSHHRLQEEVKGESGLTNNLATHHVFVTDNNVYLSHSVSNDVLHAHHLAPHGSLTLVKGGLVPPLLFVNSDNNLRGHTLEHANVAPEQSCGNSVHL